MTSSPHDPWSRLANAARNAEDERDISAPYGFSTRVAALAFAVERRGSAYAERFAFRALGIATLLALVSVALNYRELTPAPASVTVAAVAPVEEFEPIPADDAVAIVLDLAD